MRSMTRRRMALLAAGIAGATILYAILWVPAAFLRDVDRLN